MRPSRQAGFHISQAEQCFFFETSSKSLDRLISIQFQFNHHFVFWQTYQHILSKNQYFNNRFNIFLLFTIYQPWPWQTNTFLVQPDLVPAMIYTYNCIYFYNTKTAYIYIYTLWLFSIAMEHCPFIDNTNADLPIQKGWFSGSQTDK
jgi:hypothetical protein